MKLSTTFFSEHNSVDGVSLTKARFESLVRTVLLVKQYRVEVLINQGSFKNPNWVVEYKGSPGNLSQFEDMLFDNTEVVVETAMFAVKFGADASSKVFIFSLTLKTFFSTRVYACMDFHT